MRSALTHLLWLAASLTGCLGASDDSGGDAGIDPGALAAFTAAPGLCGEGDIPCADGATPPRRSDADARRGVFEEI